MFSLSTPPLPSRLTILVAIVLLGGATPAAIAVVDDDDDVSIEFAKRRIEKLRGIADELAELRMGDEAARFRRRAKEMAVRLEQRIDRERMPSGEEIDAALEGLKRANDVLGRIGFGAHQNHVERAYGALRRWVGAHRESQGSRRPSSERRRDVAELRDRDVSEWQLDGLRLAMKAMQRAGRPEAAGRLERTIHAGELRRAGRDDEAARRVYESSPQPAELAELLDLAGRYYLEWKNPDRAGVVAKLAAQYSDVARRSQQSAEIAAAKRQIATMRIALTALSDTDHHRSTKLLADAIHSREASLARAEGRSDRRSSVRRGPDRAQQAELLALAAEILTDRGQLDRAGRVAAYAKQLAETSHGVRRRAPEAKAPVPRGAVRRNPESRLQSRRSAAADHAVDPFRASTAAERPATMNRERVRRRLAECENELRRIEAQLSVLRGHQR